MGLLLGSVQHGVVVIERTNIRHYDGAHLDEPVQLAVVDVSFISLRLVLGPVRALIEPGAQVVALVKPQFEVGRQHVGRGGVVRDDALRQSAVDDVVAHAATLGFQCQDTCRSPIRGPKGNVEFFVWLVQDPSTVG